MSLNSKKNTLTNSISKMASNVASKTSNLGNKLKTGLNPIKNGLNPLKNGANPIKNSLDSVKNGAKEKMENVGKKITNVGKKITNMVPTSESINPTKLGQMSIEFLNANTAISKFVSFILYLLIFVILFQIGAGLLQRFMGPKYNPYIINGMIASDKTTIISSNPNTKKSVPIYRSLDENQGLEFTWNVWFFINSEITNNLFSGTVAPVNTTYGYRIFSKGPSGNVRLNTKTGDLNKDSLNICPGAYLKKYGNDIQLNIVMNTFVDNTSSSNFFESIQIDNIPTQKWVCCTIRVQQKAVDIYINGMLKNRKNLQNLPRQNYYDTYIGDLNGFKGYVASLRYYSYAINYDEVQSLFASGPSLKMISDSSFPETSDYLSLKWFFT
jgi:hypothetical protein